MSSDNPEGNSNSGAQNGWRSIKTAPLNGRHVLVRMKGSDVNFDGWWDKRLQSWFGRQLGQSEVIAIQPEEWHSATDASPTIPQQSALPQTTEAGNSVNVAYTATDAAEELCVSGNIGVEECIKIIQKAVDAGIQHYCGKLTNHADRLEKGLSDLRSRKAAQPPSPVGEQGLEVTEADKINVYLACIGQHGDPGMDMGNWSDFVNRVQRMSSRIASLTQENEQLREALTLKEANLQLALGKGEQFRTSLESSAAQLKEAQEERDRLKAALSQIRFLDYTNAATNGAAYTAYKIASAALSVQTASEKEKQK